MTKRLRRELTGVGGKEKGNRIQEKERAEYRERKGEWLPADGEERAKQNTIDPISVMTSFLRPNE